MGWLWRGNPRGRGDFPDESMPGECYRMTDERGRPGDGKSCKRISAYDQQILATIPEPGTAFLVALFIAPLVICLSRMSIRGTPNDQFVRAVIFRRRNFFSAAFSGTLAL